MKGESHAFVNTCKYTPLNEEKEPMAQNNNASLFQHDILVLNIASIGAVQMVTYVIVIYRIQF